MIDYDALLQRAREVRHNFDPLATQINVSQHPDYYPARLDPETARATIVAVHRACDRLRICVTYERMDGTVQGHYSPHERTIFINYGLDGRMRAAVLLHEFCHAADPNLPKITMFDHWLGSPVIPLNEAATDLAQAMLSARYGLDIEAHCALITAGALWALDDRKHAPDLDQLRRRADEIYAAAGVLLDPYLTERIAA